MPDRYRESRRKREKPPLNAVQLRDLALHYVSRYATTRARLLRYLERKLRERGWQESDGSQGPEEAHGLNESRGPEELRDPEKSGGGQSAARSLADEFARRGYVDDEAYAVMKGRELSRRGYGPRRVNQALGEAGVAAPLREKIEMSRKERAEAAIRMARRRRIGPFRRENDAPPDPKTREKHLAALLRAGHAMSDARRVLDAAQERELEEWLDELAEWEE